MLEKTFETLLVALLPWFSLGILIHSIWFFVAWIVWGSNKEEYQGITGIIRYYFHTWREVFLIAKELFEQKKPEKEENTD